MVNKVTVYKFLLLLILILSFLSYEIHLYKYYAIFQLLLTGLLVVLLMITIKIDKDIFHNIRLNFSKNFYVIILFIIMMINTLFGIYLFNYTSLSSVIKIFLLMVNTISFFIMLPILFQKYKSLLSFFESIVIVICIVLAVLAIIIKFKTNFIGYTYSYRVSGIYSDPNFFAMVLSVALLLMINKLKSNKLIIIFMAIVFYAIFLTGSRGAFLAIFISLFFAIRKKISGGIIKKLLLLAIYCFIIVLILNKLQNINFFRFSQGSNGRYEMILEAMKGFKHSPIFGYGYSSIESYLHLKGFNNASTHNSFVDFLFSYGILPTIMYIYLIVSTIIKALKRNLENDYTIILIFMVINMNTILYNLGGVGISSLLFTIFMGYTCYNILINKEETI